MLKRAVIIILSIFPCAMTFADSWAITQSVTTNANISMGQRNGSNNIQGINVIHLNGSTMTRANQSLSTGGNINLSQQATNSNHQAVNRLTVDQVNSTTQSVSINNASLNQDDLSSNNIQALNTASGTQINSLNQSVSANIVTFNGAGLNNIQAGNYIQADKANAKQTFTVNRVLYGQSGLNNIQAGNMAITNNGMAGGVVEQIFSADNVEADYSSLDPNGSIKAANYYSQ